MTNTSNESAQDLRRRAEELFRTSEVLIPEFTLPEETKRLFHELQVHQIELEMQNDELRCVLADLDSARASYFELYDLAPVGYLAVSEEGLIQKANLAAATMLGVERNFLLNKRVSQFIFPEDQDIYFLHHKRLFDSGELQNWEMRLKRHDGSHFWAELQSTLAHNGENWITLNDVTERKQMALVLEQSNKERYLDEKVRKVITDSVNEAIIMMNPQGAISFWNPAASRIWGYLPDEVLGKNLHNLLVPERYRDAYNSAHPDFLRTGRGNAIGKTLELFALHKDGREIAVELSQAAVFMDGEWHSVGIVRDITEQKSVMAQLIHSQKMETIGQLAGGLAHDMNNILTVVNGYTALAQLEIDKDHKVFNYLGEITLASSRAASLTRSLLAYSRKQEMIQQRQNLNQLIETVGSFINRIIRDNIIFTLSLQADPLSVNVDVVQMEQVLLNLASNARDAMPYGGVFNIATATGCIDAQFIANHGYGELGRYAIITTTDTGTGMDAKTSLKVFDPFFTTKEVGKGTGLGLAMVMGIIKQHGGFIDLQSEPGKGSVFQLYLPLVDSEEIAAEPAEHIYQIEKASGTILVVEDDADTLNALEELMTRAGYTVITAIDGQDAVEKFTARKDEIELVISDVVMPRKSGKAAYDEIREMSESVKFIFVSGHSSDVILREGEFGADVEIIAKPIMPFELLRKMREIIPHTIS